MNKYIGLFIVVIFGTLLGGCNDSKKQEDTDTTEPKVSEVKKQQTINSTKEINVKKIIWDSEKESQLKSFVNGWGKEMNQDYTFYESNDELKWNNLVISARNLEKNKTIDLNGKKQSISIFSSKDEENVLNIVAIASDEEDNNVDNHHLYFFSLLNDKPLVLIVSEKSTSSNIIASETKNNELKSGFTNIIEQTNEESNKTDTSISKFDTLSNDIKALLLTEAVDDRLETRFDELNQPDAMFLNYYIEDNYIYLFFTSGVGTGHPIYLLEDEGSTIKPLQTVSRVSYDEYKEFPPKSINLDKEILFEKYNANPEKYDLAVTNFKVGSTINEKAVFEDMVKRIGIKNKVEKEEVVTSSTKPSAEEIYRYYKDYIVYDAGINSEVLQQRMEMKGVDENGFPIIAHVVHGSEINISMDGDVINYNVYSIGGANDDGTPAKSHLFDAFYNYKTGEHGVK
ncbi:DUF4767 domain-containing protein [Vagococcus luciliae]|uniref:DUF4767 domain-containing protein n=1 Tax=Vagococcus luciliae TaxID=2920380 RepID=A0ABY5NYQ2_9ENTE|nr:DUF4767 domain-containing protein [Vagococcus luciliae]UUV98790.1 hypothetical protein G314FT_09440 [Vagococcus luciliae]